jgi:tetratricopeptide (TPR) repeat protein
MWDLAVREDDFKGIDAMLARYRGRPALSFRLIPALARADSNSIGPLMQEARTQENRQLQITARYTASYLEDFPTADSLARLDLAWRERAPNRAHAQILIAGLAAAQGRWNDAREAFRLAETMEGAAQVGIYRAMAALAPMLPVPPADFRAMREDIDRWGPTMRIEGTGLAGQLQPHLRLFLLGMVDSRLGDSAGVARVARELEGLARPPGSDGVVEGMAATLRADLAWARGRPGQVLELLGSTWRPIPLELVAVPRPVHFRMFSLEHARLLRALALAELRRDTDALAWLRYGFRGSPQEFLYLGPIHYRMGEVFERLKQPDSAVVHYRKFLQIWKAADSGAAAVLDEARNRLSRLTAQAHP